MLYVSKTDNNFIVSFSENVDRLNTLIIDEFRDILANFVIHPNNNLVLDLKGIKFIDSNGFSTLSALIKIAKKNSSKLKFININDEVMELVELVHMQDEIELCTV